MKKKRFTEAQIIGVLKEGAAGAKVKRSCGGPAVERPVTATAVVQGLDRE